MIYGYTTSHTPEAVYILGGIKGAYAHDYTSAVSKFQNNIWSELQPLSYARGRFGSITIGGQTLILGGIIPGFG